MAIDTREQLAGIFIKPLEIAKFEYLCHKLMGWLYNKPIPTRMKKGSVLAYGFKNHDYASYRLYKMETEMRNTFFSFIFFISVYHNLTPKNENPTTTLSCMGVLLSIFGTWWLDLSHKNH